MTRWQPQKIAARAAHLRGQGRTDDAAKLERQLNAVGCCRACGRKLSDPVSITRGIGSDCWAQGRR